MNIQEFKDKSEWQQERILGRISVIYWVKRIVLLAFFLLVAGMAGCPPYNVWQQGLTGQAELKRAEQNRQILINEAKAKEESATHWANAEIERAKGAAEANRIVSNSLGGPEGYLRWLYIEKLGEITNGQIIYIPTEAAMPILEAGKR